MTAALRTRPPTGLVPYPVVLIEGEEKAGKSYACAVLSASKRVGQTFWLDLAEGAADEYAAIPGADYLVVDHDGSYADVLAQVLAVKEAAAKAKTAGEPPTVLVVDSMTALWDMLKDWASGRAKGSATNRRRLADDPNAEVVITMNLWNDATSRYNKVNNALLTFPGIVLLTARGKVVAQMDDAGKPVEGRKDYRVEGHKSLPWNASLWVRMSRTSPPLVIGARSVHVGLIPGKDDPQPLTYDHADGLLDWLIFDVLKVDAGSQVRQIAPLSGGELTPDERTDEAPAAPKPQSRQEHDRMVRDTTSSPKRAERVRGEDVKATDAWAEKVATIPDTSVDAHAWYVGWAGRVASCPSLPQLKGLWGELVSQHEAGQATDEMRKDGLALRQERAGDLQQPVSEPVPS